MSATETTANGNGVPAANLAANGVDSSQSLPLDRIVPPATGSIDGLLSKKSLSVRPPSRTDVKADFSTDAAAPNQQGDASMAGISVPSKQGATAGRAGRRRSSADTRDPYSSSEDDSEDEEFNESKPTDRYGFFETSERHGPDVPEGELQHRAEKEGERALKWARMYRKWDRMVRRKPKKLKRRVHKGIPDSLRGEVWRLLSGSKDMMEASPARFQELLDSDLKVDGPIEEDIPRTMYDHEMFCRQSRLHGRSKLRRVLTAYGRHDREVQYCQGINYITALLLLYMPEEAAFWQLVAVMQRPAAPLRLLFLPGMVKAQEFQYVIDSLTLKYCPALSRHITKSGLDPNMYATQWFLTCFTQRFPYDLVTRIWDVFLLEDWKIMYRVCLALFKFAEPHCLPKDLEHMNIYLRDLPTVVDSPVIMDLAFAIPLKHRHIQKRMKEYARKAQR